MDKYKININDLDKKLNAPTMMKYAEVKDQMRKIAYDVVVFRDNPERLWQIVDDDNGNQFIVAMYDGEEDSLSKSSSDENPWSVEINKSKTSATIFYRSTPINNVDLVKNAVSDVLDFKAAAPKMLKESKELVAKMINELDDEYRQYVISKYPEIL